MTTDPLRESAIKAANRMRENNREVHRVMFPHADEQKLWDESTDKANVMARFILSLSRSPNNLQCGHHISNQDRTVESGTVFCRLCDLDSRRRDAEKMEREHLEIVRDLRRKLAEAGIEGSPPPGGMGTIPTLAAENARLREWNQRLWTDVLHWLQLAKNQREWFRHNHEYGTNAGPCPTDAAIEQSERLLTAPKETKSDSHVHL